MKLGAANGPAGRARHRAPSRRTDSGRAAAFAGARLLIGAALAAGLASSAASSSAAELSTERLAEVSTRRLAPAPRFKIKDLAGRALDLDELRRGGPVLLDFWATWCKPCLAAIPEIQALHQRYGSQGLKVIGISVDGPRNYSKVRPFAARLGIKYRVAFDLDGRLQQLYQVVAMPTAILIDRDGRIAAVRVGFRPGEGDELEAKIRALLASSDNEDAQAPAADSARGETTAP